MALTDHYVASDKIHVYPCTNRGNGYDIESQYLTEYNLTHNVSTGTKNSYVIGYNNDSTKIRFVLGGYFFEVEETALLAIGYLPLQDELYASIKVGTSDLTTTTTTTVLKNFETSTDSLDLTGQFLGVHFSTSLDSDIQSGNYYVQIRDNNQHFVNQSTIDTVRIDDYAVTTAKIASEAVTSAKLAKNIEISEKLTTNKIYTTGSATENNLTLGIRNGSTDSDSVKIYNPNISASVSTNGTLLVNGGVRQSGNSSTNYFDGKTSFRNGIDVAGDLEIASSIKCSDPAIIIYTDDDLVATKINNANIAASSSSDGTLLVNGGIKAKNDCYIEKSSTTSDFTQKYKIDEQGITIVRDYEESKAYTYTDSPLTIKYTKPSGSTTEETELLKLNWTTGAVTLGGTGGIDAANGQIRAKSLVATNNIVRGSSYIKYFHNCSLFIYKNNNSVYNTGITINFNNISTYSSDNSFIGYWTNGESNTILENLYKLFNYIWLLNGKNASNTGTINTPATGTYKSFDDTSMQEYYNYLVKFRLIKSTTSSTETNYLAYFYFAQTSYDGTSYINGQCYGLSVTKNESSNTYSGNTKIYEYDTQNDEPITTTRSEETDLSDTAGCIRLVDECTEIF